ncbi:hypothetical protein F3Y22_tig00110828pilonHSYRG00141 [Hibiscus syriacus]|uniref:Legume-specific protein n=1 Tax=Hibiscus syriacus TaxID=106335 RepID=A0A6A2ZN22_HIBSY|nr:hypothetical protein F3Y22_tig00110828pilonHSYRG00141 [Hibiscus syriacus]
MEGLIPFVYRAIVQYMNGNEEHHVLASWFNDSPSASYTRLPTGDSGRFQMSDERVFESHNQGSSSSPMSSSSSTAAKIILSAGVQYPAVCRLPPRRVLA